MVVTYTTVAGRIVHENRGGVERFYGQDPLGSTSALYDTSGNKTDEWFYWPYGEVRSHTGSSTTPFTFGGTLGYYTDQAGQLYVRARVLDPERARWLTMGPLWPDESAYGYARAMPATIVDPFGTCAHPGCVVEPSDRAGCVAICRSEGKAFRQVVCVTAVHINCLFGAIEVCRSDCYCFEHRVVPKPLPSPPPIAVTTRTVCIAICLALAKWVEGFDLQSCLDGCPPK